MCLMNSRQNRVGEFFDRPRKFDKFLRNFGFFTKGYFRLNRRFLVIWFLLAIALVVSHMMALAAIDNLLVTHIYDTYHGYTEISVRILFAVWFLSELKKTFGFINAFDNYSVLASSRDLNNNNGGGGNSIVSSGFNSRKFAEELDELNEDYMASEAAGVGMGVSPPRSPVTRPNALMLSSMMNVKQRIKMFYLHFGAWSLVWFIYLPVLVFISQFVSDLFRFRLFISEFLMN